MNIDYATIAALLPFAVGDAVYIIKERDSTVFQPCAFCGGAGSLEAVTCNNTTLFVTCPKCKEGKVKLGKPRRVYDVKRCKIRSVTVGFDGSGAGTVCDLFDFYTRKHVDLTKNGRYHEVFYTDKAAALLEAQRLTDEADKAAGFTDKQVAAESTSE